MNDQYFLMNDSLSFVRNFNVNIEVFPIDSSGTIWRVEEKIYKFDKSVVTCIRKTELTNDLDGFDFTLKKIKPDTIVVEWQDMYKKKQEELNKLLALKDSEMRE